MNTLLHSKIETMFQILNELIDSNEYRAIKEKAL